jgi:Aerotolerance regulator N-terminal/von Willebrand factor type A domain
MTFGFLAPLFLAGLAALAVPVLVHLVRREERTSVVFPSLMFLQRLPTPERRRRTIRHWWLLALRCLALTLLCLAFAKPFIRLPAAGGAGESSRDRVVLLDRSYSMAYSGRWQQALQAARDAIAELGHGERGAVILFDHETEIASDLTAEHALLNAALATARPGVGHTKLLSAVERAGNLLQESKAQRREIVLISDFQRSGFEEGKPLRLSPAVHLIPRIVAGGNAANAAIATVKVERRRRGSGDSVQLLARVLNTGALAMNALDVALYVNDRKLEQRRLSLAPGAAGEVSFNLVIDVTELSRVRVQLPDDALAADNAQHLVLSGGRTIAVLLLQDKDARTGQALYLQRALNQATLPPFRLQTRTLEELRETDIDGADVIVINDAPIPGGPMEQHLRRFLDGGGGLLIVAAERMHGTWPNGEQGLVPGGLGRSVDRSGAAPARLVGLRTTHPVLAAFNTSDGGDLAAAQVYRYRELSDVAADAILARYDDGAVALAERRIGRGRVLVFTTTLDPYWNTLPLQPGYLPLLHETLKYLGGYVPAANAFAIGDAVDLGRQARGLPGHAMAAAALARGAVSLVRTPSGRQQHLAGGAGVLRIDETGFYEAHVSGGGARSLIVAANARTDESRLEPLDTDALLAAIDRSAPSPERLAGYQAREPNRYDSAWWFLLLVCVLLLALETLVSNRLSERTSMASKA